MRPPFALGLAALLVAGLAVAPARAEDVLKLGFVDTARIFEQYKVAQDAQKQFDRDVESWNHDLSDQKNEIAKLKQELDNQSLVLSDAKRREKEAALSRKQSEYQAKVDDIWGPKGRATLRNEELVKNVIDKVKKALDTLAQKEGYTLILDAASNRILFGVKSYDLTDRVVEQLNQEASESTSGLAPAHH
ncbi:MAG TPA: OmpH family outer membrane protein [Candidatus Saccharimonadales bacterium]|nr:OmpH family outer membrane protein [Candidatus Saccharimonadales bacterium]